MYGDPRGIRLRVPDRSSIPPEPTVQPTNQPQKQEVLRNPRPQAPASPRMDPVELRGNQEVSRIADRAVTALLSKARIPPLAPLEAGQRISTAELRPMMRHLVAALYARVRGAYPGVLGRTLQEGVEGSVLQAVASGAFDFLLAKARSKNPALPDDHRARDKGPEDPNAVMPLEMVFRLFQEKTPPKRISYAPPPGPRNKT